MAARKKKAAKKKAAKSKPVKKAATRARKSSRRYWLMFPAKLVSKPVVYQLGHKFNIETNIRQASVHDDVGLVSLELTGDRPEIQKSIKWLEKAGVKVEPVEINVIAG